MKMAYRVTVDFSDRSAFEETIVIAGSVWKAAAIGKRIARRAWRATPNSGGGRLPRVVTVNEIGEVELFYRER